MLFLIYTFQFVCKYEWEEKGNEMWNIIQIPQEWILNYVSGSLEVHDNDVSENWYRKWKISLV